MDRQDDAKARDQDDGKSNRTEEKIRRREEEEANPLAPPITNEPGS